MYRCTDGHHAPSQGMQPVDGAPSLCMHMQTDHHTEVVDAHLVAGSLITLRVMGMRGAAVEPVTCHGHARGSRQASNLLEKPAVMR
jgi:hypothetical protein